MSLSNHPDQDKTTWGEPMLTDENVVDMLPLTRKQENEADKMHLNGQTDHVIAGALCAGKPELLEQRKQQVKRYLDRAFPTRLTKKNLVSA